MTLAQRMKKGLTKMLPSNKINYTAPVTPPPRKKVMIEVKKSPNTGYKMPKTPKSSGIGWGP